MEPNRTAVASERTGLGDAGALSMAHRLLCGSGRASMTAYDLVPDAEEAALCHGLSDAGELMVACVADAGVTVAGYLPLRVRLDVLKEAPEPSVRITAFAVHLLGTLEWLTDEVTASYLAEPGVPARLAELASARGGRLGLIRTERVLVHDATGITSVPFEEIVARHLAAPSGRPAAFPVLEQEWAARELVGRLTPADLFDLLVAAESGWDAAATLSSREQYGCPHLDGQVYCVDVDSTGFALMAIRDGIATVFRFAFTEAVETIEELAGQIDQLLRRSAEVSAPGR